MPCWFLPTSLPASYTHTQAQDSFASCYWPLVSFSFFRIKHQNLWNSAAWKVHEGGMSFSWPFLPSVSPSFLLICLQIESLISLAQYPLPGCWFILLGVFLNPCYGFLEVGFGKHDTPSKVQTFQFRKLSLCLWVSVFWGSTVFVCLFFPV